MTDGDNGRVAPLERREQIRRQILADGFARVDDMARTYGVSVMTVHRDLDALVTEGWLIKLRGGATANPSALLTASVPDRTKAMRREKAAIAAAAAAEIHQGQTIFLDDSTTAMALAPHLIERAPLTVATNFLPVVARLGEVSSVDLIVLGGKYQRIQDGCYGVQTIDAIRELHADVLFMSTTAVLDGACYHRSEATLMVRRSMIEHAARTVLMIDHAKFGRPAPHLLGRLDDFDLLVTDAGLDDDDQADVRQHDIELVVADPV
ncbi:DeoR family transcriptional regulator [Actinocatenispora thailandica]|uniref:DeoR family transcriptional regulator n=1 Tax=Actinocatenispora thailandica TaxID=227318 RepID=A0A7R7DLI6_9ACTN|nr:DeoR/GlpR family DNA-binding transcription regulator [Actinocatenispora thailandica]BCJ33755.1 DeoR family transcriptional regulator [Actinocatenispora thailandica]